MELDIRVAQVVQHEHRRRCPVTGIAGDHDGLAGPDVSLPKHPEKLLGTLQVGVVHIEARQGELHRAGDGQSGGALHRNSSDGRDGRLQRQPADALRRVLCPQRSA